MRHPLAVAAALLAVSAAPGRAQSRDRDRPTPLTAPEVVGHMTPDETVEHFYGFTAGPGEVKLTVEARPGQGHATWAADLADTDANELLSVSGHAVNAQSERKVARVRLARAQPVVLRVVTKAGSTTQDATYLVRVEGAVAGASAASAASAANGRLRVPARGTLRIDMKNGTTQNVDLGRVRAVQVLP
jgi:hypothetical protein